jgi:hypothetical protein
MRTAAAAVLGAAIALLAAPSIARADGPPPPAERLQVYSPYEQQTINDVLADLHQVRDPAPEGKIIASVEVVPLDVFEPRDVLPQWLNVFHVTTREAVIRREVLLHAGEPYRQALVDDTVRNLRRLPGLPQLSLVIVMATVGSDANHVNLVVITKDVWSLRLNWNVLATPGGIEQFAMQPSETNFLGTHQIVAATFVLEPSAYTIGAGYTVPRLGTSRVAMQAAANVMVNRTTGNLEGTYGQLVAGQPLFSGKTEWAWDSNVQWQDVVNRRYENAQLVYYFDKDTQEAIPFQWRSRAFLASYAVTRSFGWDINHDFTLAVTMNPAVYRVNFPTASAKTIADFERAYVPVSDTRVGPSIQYHTYEMRFLRVIDFDTLALQEDYRLGHDVLLRVFPSPRALGSSRDVISLYGAAQYTWGLRDGLFRVSVVSDVQPQTDRIADAYLLPTAHLVTPSIGELGRIVLDGTLTWRWRNYLNITDSLGGDDRLRGFPTSFFVGQNVLRYNVEFRTRPLEIFSMELGGVAFFDAGDAWGPSRFVPYQDVGVGVRALIPWLDRTVFRVDLGFPIERPLDPSTGAPVAPFQYVFTFTQAFGTPTVSPVPLLPTGQGADAP